MTPARKRRLFFVLAIILVAAAIVALVTFAFRENINLFYSPSQLAEAEIAEGQRVRIGGMVVDGSVERDNETLKVKFAVTDGLAETQVRYQGILPDLFREGQGIVARGLVQPDGSFEAEEVLAKHDENYMPPEVKDTIVEGTDAARALEATTKKIVPTAGGSDTY